MRLSSLERFVAECQDAGGSECWLWTRGLDERGYGRAWHARRRYLAHRAVYEIVVGPIPDGLVLDHLCRVPNCVNPAHLEPVTNAVNVVRGVGPTAQNARKTHCKRGHELAGDNLEITSKGRRRCRACNAMLTAEFHARDRRGEVTRPPCSIDGCPGQAEVRGWCRSHYNHWYKHGDPLTKRGRAA